MLPLKKKILRDLGQIGTQDCFEVALYLFSSASPFQQTLNWLWFVYNISSPPPGLLFADKIWFSPRRQLLHFQNLFHAKFYRAYRHVTLHVPLEPSQGQLLYTIDQSVYQFPFPIKDVKSYRFDEPSNSFAFIRCVWEVGNGFHSVSLFASASKAHS